MFGIYDVLTGKQVAVLQYIKEYKSARGSAPTYREIAGHFRFRSSKSAWDHVQALKKKGFVSLNGGRSRGIDLPDQEKTATNGAIYVPVMGDIQAGYPVDQSELMSGTLTVDPAIIDRQTNHRFFALRVHGESMNGRGIYDSDWVVADADASPLEGDIVVALIDGRNTLKTLARRNDVLYLKAENPDYPDIVPIMDMVVQGVVKALLRRI
jgi:repressor LexA